MFLSYAQNGEDAMLWRALADVRDGFYIDVGACDPDADSVTRAFYERGWRGINIEPSLEDYRLLESRRPRDVNLNVATGAAEGEAAFFRIAGTGLSTIDAAQAREHEGAGWTLETRQTPVTTLRKICSDHAPDIVHFLKIDCEGAERATLEGADFTACRPWIVVIEATRPNSQEKTHEAWEPLLTAADYAFVWFDGLNRFYLAAEQRERLQRHFEAPLNAFDQFAKAAPPPPPAPAARDPFEAAQAELVDNERRIAIAARCRDADPIPKVADAGAVRTLDDGARVQIMHNGVKVPADGYCGSWMTRLIAQCGGHHEPQEERAFHEVVKRAPQDATMIELGGYWSYYSAWFLQGAPARRAVVLEPDPAHRAVGERTMALNGLNAEFIDGFVGAAPQAPTLFRTEDSGEMLLSGFSVPQVIADRAIERLDILHCDAQGAELAVLESCRPLFARRRINWVFVSTHAFQITGDPLTHQRCLALLREAGASIEAEHDVHESFSGDGLIVARFCDAPADWRPLDLSRNRYSESLFRNPLYDLARQMRRAPQRDLMEQVVAAAYEKLLLRRADLAGLEWHTDGLARSGDFAGLLEKFLRSGEFRYGFRAFAKCYLADSALAEERYFERDGPMECSSLTFALSRNGPLGKRGDILSVPADRLLAPALFAQGSWRAEHVAFVVERLNPRGAYTLIDIGANIGLFTRQFLNAFVGIASAYCIEPDGENFRALRDNLKGYRHGRLHFFNIALGSADGDAPFYRDGDNCGNYSLIPDAMRDRPFETTTARVAAAGPWLEATLAGKGRIVWKSDTQGCDELIVGQVPWSVWRRVDVALIELWRIDKTGLDCGDFLAKIDSFPNKRLGERRSVSTRDVEDYLASTDWAHADLFLWR